MRTTFRQAQLVEQMESPLCRQRRNFKVCRTVPLWRAGFLFLLLALCGVMAVRATSFTAVLDRDTITLGESAVLSLKFEDGGPNTQPTLPSIPGLQITYMGPSSQFSFINGRTTSSVTHNFNITARKAGDYVIPALIADVGGQKLDTPPLRLKVLQPGAPPPEAINSGEELAFMKLVLPRNEIYLGETITVGLDLYFRDNIQGISGFRLTSLPADGVTVGKMGQGQEQRVQIRGTTYRKIPLAVALTPIKTGQTEIGPVTASVVIQIASQNRRRDPFFEQFGIRDPFGDFNSEQRRIQLVAAPEAVQLLPLPTNGVPANFNGAVGSYVMTVSAGPTNVTAGDPVTVKVQIAGRGAFDAVNLPEQPSWDGFKIYPPTSKTDTTDQFGLYGTKTFEEIVVPQSADVHELPAFAFSYFDPETKTYKTLTQPAVPLLVRPGGTTPMPVVAGNTAKPEAPPPPRDIVPIKQHFGGATQVGPPLATQPWFLAVQSAPVLAWMCALVWRKRSDALANNPRLRRQRHVSALVREGRDELRRLAADNKGDEFFAKLFHLLQEQVGERLDCPASSITEAVVEERLRPAGVPEPVLNELHELFQACNLARYAPVRSSHELAAFIPKLEKVLRELEEVTV